MSKLLIGREYSDEIIASVKEAKNSIKILMFDWRWYSHEPGSKIQKLNQEIVRAMARGVEVSAVLNNNFILRILQNIGVKAICTNSTKKMHIKVVIIDEKIIFIGSHNFSMNGFEINHEMSLKLEDAEIVNRCNKYFDVVKLT